MINIYIGHNRKLIAKNRDLEKQLSLVNGLSISKQPSMVKMGINIDKSLKNDNLIKADYRVPNHNKNSYVPGISINDSQKRSDIDIDNQIKLMTLTILAGMTSQRT